MSQLRAVPFFMKRSSDRWAGDGYTSRKEVAHGLLRLEDDRLVVQWRVSVKTETLASTHMSSEEDVEPVREIVIPLRRVAGASVRQRWWDLFSGGRLVLTGADLRAFEAVAGAEGLKLSHPARLELRIRRSDRLDAQEFAADVSLALAQLPRGDEREDRALEPPT